MARDEPVTAKVIEGVREPKPSDAVSVGCIARMIGIGAFVAGSGLLLMVVAHLRRPLRYMGIRLETAPEVALTLMGVGLAIILANTPIRERLESATREPESDLPSDTEEEQEEEGDAEATAPRT